MNCTRADWPYVHQTKSHPLYKNSVPSKVVVTCESQTAFLSCDQGSIKVLSANYGRTDRQTCSAGRPYNQLSNVRCTQSTSLRVVAIRCDGKTSCSIVAGNAAFTDPCYGTYKYLTVSYKCVAPPPPSPRVPSKVVVTCESQTAFLSCAEADDDTNISPSQTPQFTTALLTPVVYVTDSTPASERLPDTHSLLSTASETITVNV
ncbi:putative L-rhamnose-binding lectin CSL2 [Triplophysa rosa]|uniref:L-rhamnose-binding lectin CSL2 n=1 Tax=Triplophysa rosa TaxID=992332 RepID=A0A9W7T7B3_TRIRA|nr:putative L-rhamnose-binding lectin CSL2 [Triplophysa rosa]